MPTYPLTIIVRHPEENPKKCSVVPLKGRDDVLFFTFPSKQLPPCAGYIRLAAAGPELSLDDRDSRASCCSTAVGVLRQNDRALRRRAATLAAPAGKPPIRVSKQGNDPDNGLASIEALYLAYHILGRPTAGLPRALSLGRAIPGVESFGEW